MVRGRHKSTRDSPPTQRRRPSARVRAPRYLRFLGAAGLVPPFALAFYALTLPWARARVVLVPITRSAGATALVVAALALALVAGIGLALHGGRPRTTGLVHLAMGLLLGAVSWKAYTLIRAAGVHALFIPIASVRRGAGWYDFTLAAALLVLLGLVELSLAQQLAARRRAAARTAAAPEHETVSA